MSIRGLDESRLIEALEAAGLDDHAARPLAVRFGRLARKFEHQRPVRDRERWEAWHVPGRVEVLGKHTDYAGGRSLIAAIERGLCVIGAPRTDGVLSITDAGRESSVILDVAQPRPALNWARYPATVLARLTKNFPGAVGGADVIFESNLPSASGLSSSSALMIAVLLAVARLSRLEASSVWTANITSNEDLAAYAATIENGSRFRELHGEHGVGTLGGSEDHTAILCSTPGQLAHYSFRPTRRERTVPLMEPLLFAIAVSGVRAQKTGNAQDDYNRLSQRASSIVERWRAASGRRDDTLAEALASSGDAEDRLRRLLRADAPALLDRFEQFVEESTILVPSAATQLERGDLEGFGATAARSQDLAERLLGNQVPETITLSRLARMHGAIAASAFGAGFGGSVWALVDRSRALQFVERWQEAYARVHPMAAARSTFFLTRPGPAAVRIGS
jgi:galactokinase